MIHSYSVVMLIRESPLPCSCVTVFVLWRIAPMQPKGRRGYLYTYNDPIICRMEGHMIMSGTVVSVSCCLLARILTFIKSFVFPSKPHMSPQGCGYFPLPTSFALEAVCIVIKTKRKWPPTVLTQWMVQALP